MVENVRVRNEQMVRDRLFVQEIMNDMARRGHTYSKSWDLLTDWSRELREKAHMHGRCKRMFCELVGKYLW